MSTAFLTRLKQRKLVQWALAYLAGAWLLLPVVKTTREPAEWQDIARRLASTDELCETTPPSPLYARSKSHG